MTRIGKKKLAKSNGQNIHTNTLQASPMDLVMLGEAVEIRFLQLTADYLRIKFENLPIPSELDSDLYLWRSMRVRHRKHDYRNTIDEKKSTRTVAEWTYKTNCVIKNQKYAPIEWSE